MKNVLDSLTPLFVVQAVLSLIIVAAFVYQEITVHNVDGDLKLLTFAVIGYWFGAIVEARTAQLSNGVLRNDKQS